MKKLGKKKLQLGHETIRALGSDSLVNANGGLTFTLLCGVYTEATHCDLQSVTCSVAGFDFRCTSKIG